MIVSWEIKSKQRTKSQIVNLFIDIGKKRKKLLSTIRERRLAHCHFFFFFGTVSLSSTIHFEVTLSFRFNCPFFSNIFYRTFVDDINALRSPASNFSLFFFFFYVVATILTMNMVIKLSGRYHNIDDDVKTFPAAEPISWLEDVTNCSSVSPVELFKNRRRVDIEKIVCTIL